MAKACYDPGASIEMWKRMKKGDGGESSVEFLSTHPSHDNRITKISEWIQEAQQTRDQAGCEQTSSFMKLFKNSFSPRSGI